MNERDLLEDANKLKIIELLQYLPIRPGISDSLTPYQAVFAELAARYQVPSPADRGEPVRSGPEIPEGKVRNG